MQSEKMEFFAGVQEKMTDAHEEQGDPFQQIAVHEFQFVEIGCVVHRSDNHHFYMMLS